MTKKRKNLFRFYEILGYMKVLLCHCINLSISEQAEILLGSWSARLSSLNSMFKSHDGFLLVNAWTMFLFLYY